MMNARQWRDRLMTLARGTDQVLWRQRYVKAARGWNRLLIQRGY